MYNLVWFLHITFLLYNTKHRDRGGGGAGDIKHTTIICINWVPCRRVHDKPRKTKYDDI